MDIYRIYESEKYAYGSVKYAYESANMQDL